VIDEYFAEIRAVLDRYAAASFVLSVNVNFDRRPGEQGHVRGVVAFEDGSTLHCSEFLDATGGVLDKLMYRYHYQEADSTMVSRYDNALHKPALKQEEHKHDFGGVYPAAAPELGDVLAEVAMSRGWL
jgi:hypothetical protein